MLWGLDNNESAAAPAYAAAADYKDSHQLSASRSSTLSLSESALCGVSALARHFFLFYTIVFTAKKMLSGLKKMGVNIKSTKP